MATAIGIDTGGTLTKLAYVTAQGQLKVQAFPSNDMARVKAWLDEHPQVDQIGLTGGRTEQLKDVLHTMKETRYVVEFEATIRGLRYLLGRAGNELERAIVTNIGTGTSIHLMEGLNHTRVSGTGIGGGTLVGLSSLMTGERQFETITRLAEEGERKHIDLLVKDIYQGMDTPIDGNLTASNFGKVGISGQQHYTNADMIATVQGLVGEVITTLSIQLAKEHAVEHIVYIGSTLTDNPHLKRVIRSYTELKQHTPIFLENCGFSGALGALLYMTEQGKM